MKLSVQSASALPPGQTLKDHVVKGLELRARAGVKSWHLYYRFNGRRNYPRLGHYPIPLGIDDARELAKEWLKQVARGINPGAQRAEARKAPTVKELADLYVAEYRKQVEAKTREPRSFDEVARHCRLYIKPGRLGRMRVCDVTTADVNKRLRAVARKAPVYANRIRDTLSGMFTFAEADAYKFRPKNTNPCKDKFIEKFREFGRNRTATAAELKALRPELIKLRAQYPHRTAALFVILLGGTRVKELLISKRSEIMRDDKGGSVITLKAHKTGRRTGQPRRIYLSRQALEAIDSVPNDGSDYLFGAELARINEKGDSVGRHLVHDVWDMARKAAGCPDLQVLDLRRTFASGGKSSGVPLEAIGELFGHGDIDTTMRYAFLFDDAARSHTQAISDVLSQRMGAESVTRSLRSGLRMRRRSL